MEQLHISPGTQQPQPSAPAGAHMPYPQPPSPYGTSMAPPAQPYYSVSPTSNVYTLPVTPPQAGYPGNAYQPVPYQATPIPYPAPGALYQTSPPTAGLYNPVTTGSGYAYHAPPPPIHPQGPPIPYQTSPPTGPYNPVPGYPYQGPYIPPMPRSTGEPPPPPYLLSEECDTHAGETVDVVANERAFVAEG